jgi:hypothetical protein
MIDPERAKEIFGDRQRAYLLTFGREDAVIGAAVSAVLSDLATFCRANEPSVAVPSPGAPIDIYRTFLNEGRREVYLRIMDHLKLSTEQLVQKSTRPAQGAISHDDRDPPEPA